MCHVFFGRIPSTGLFTISKHMFVQLLFRYTQKRYRIFSAQSNGSWKGHRKKSVLWQYIRFMEWKQSTRKCLIYSDLCVHGGSGWDYVTTRIISFLVLWYIKRTYIAAFRNLVRRTAFTYEIRGRKSTWRIQ